MANARYDRHSAATAVRPPSSREPGLRQGWGSPGAQRPTRLTQHATTDDPNAAVRPLAAALGGVALVLIATALIVLAFAF